MIGIPLAFAAYAIRSYMLIFDTNRVIAQNWDSLEHGTEHKAAECPNITADLTATAVGTGISVIETAPGGALLTMFPKLFYRNFMSIMEVATTTTNLFVEALRSIGVIARTVPTLNKSVPPTPDINKAGASIKGGGGSSEEWKGVPETPLWIPMTAGLFSLTIGFIVVSSLVLYFRRRQKNEPTKAKATAAATTATVKRPSEDDDAPPEPGVPGVVAPSEE